ncbi:hypothetical protein ANN_21075 [Periplaneta americana]|uniref:HAT C-terminal dimerisation domain-containing protein n=1 Tax=Periplaneta americana TaxID=6978 RepID=A0ABQ8SFI9_PERAM|nr:hypothetical protein ANN_21075 [Periplaneta americana]
MEGDIQRPNMMISGAIVECRSLYRRPPEAADSLDRPPWNVVQRCWMASAMAPEADLLGEGVSPQTDRGALGEVAEAGMINVDNVNAHTERVKTMSYFKDIKSTECSVTFVTVKEIIFKQSSNTSNVKADVIETLRALMLDYPEFTSAVLKCAWVPCASVDAERLFSK